jgi:hypothetical protein
MHTIFRAIVGALLLALIIGCSSQHQAASPVMTSDITLENGSPPNDEGIMRYLAAEEDKHDDSDLIYVSNRSVSVEGLSDYQSVLVDCIANTHWEQNTETDYHNYLLVCDSKNRWGGSTNDRCSIFRIPSDLSRAYPEGTEDDAYATGDIVDPDACEISENGDDVFVFVYDGGQSPRKIYGWKYDINTSTGVIENGRTINANYDPLSSTGLFTSCKGMTWIPNGDNDWHLVICDLEAQEVVILNSSGTVVKRDSHYDQSGENDYPFDACVVQESSTEWTVYVAVAEGNDSWGRYRDYIYAYHYSSGSYGSDSKVHLYPSGTTVYFDYIIGLANRKYNDVDDDTKNSIAVLMWDIIDMEGYRIIQGYCESSSSSYSIWGEDFDVDDFEDPDFDANSVIEMGSSFALGKMSKGTTIEPPDPCWVYGNYYFVADRDPDIVLNMEENPDEDCLDGQNVKIWKNYDVIICN